MKTVIFDLYGTLVDIRTDENQQVLWQKMALFFAEHNAAYTPESLKKAYQKQVTEKTRHVKKRSTDSHESSPEIEILDVFQALFAARGIEAGPDLLQYTAQFFRILSIEYIRLYPGAAKLLEDLRKAGYQVILLSNAQAAFTLDELKILGIDQAFDAVYISSRYGCKKPDSRFFDICLQEQKVQPSLAVMVGNDGTSDIAGARSAGLHTLYIRSNISPDEPLPDADWVLEEMDLERVADILLSLR